MRYRPEVALHQARRRHPLGAVLDAHPPSPDELCLAIAIIRSRPPFSRGPQELRRMERQLPWQRHYYNTHEYVELFGSSPDEIARVEEFARSYGLDVVESDPGRRCIMLSGPLRTYARAFDVEFVRYTHPSGTYRSYHRAVRVPRTLARVIEAVLGFDDRPGFKHHAMSVHLAGERPVEAEEVARAYRFPSSTGHGQTIGIIELAGGFHLEDIRAFAAKHNIAAPRVSVVELDGQKNDPARPSLVRRFWTAFEAAARSGTAPPGSLTGSADSDNQVEWTIETTMDIELTMAFAPCARIVVYLAPNTPHGKYHALSTALTDHINSPSIISCSWGSPEEDVTIPGVFAIERLLQSAALRGVTVCFSSGDDGDGSASDGKRRVNFPASSPYALACGGTHLAIRPRGRIHETVWNETMAGKNMASTGGSSRLFRAPRWQRDAHITRISGHGGRGIPDVAAKADLAGGYGTIVGGIEIPMGGTSAAAPLWAGLTARINEILGVPVGLLSPLLYTPALRGVTHFVTRGDNGPNFHAAPGWNACTGWGSPKGAKLLRALRGKSSRSR